MYVNHGKAAERVIQERLFYAGVLDCPYRFFQETSVYCNKTGITGRLDGILLLDRAKAVGAIEIKEVPKDSRRVILEIKETSDFGFGKITKPSDIPEKFQWAQTAYQRITGIHKTCFLYVNRDSMALKPMFYEGTDEIWEKIQSKCRKIWDYVDRRVIPLPDGDVSVEEYAARSIILPTEGLTPENPGV